MLKKRSPQPDCVSEWPGEYTNRTVGTGATNDQITNPSATVSADIPSQTSNVGTNPANGLALVKRGICPPSSPLPDYSQQYATGQGKPSTSNGFVALGMSGTLMMTMIPFLIFV